MREEPTQLDLFAWTPARGPCPVQLDPFVPSPVVLHRIDPETNMRRFYRLSVAHSLFGEWGVVRQWGRIGTKGQDLTEWHGSRDGAQEAMGRVIRRKRRRGYDEPLGT